MYAIQQQALGSIQWNIIASSLKETSYTVSTLSKGVRYAFRVLSITTKAFSKPSPATDAVQLLDTGTCRDTRESWLYLEESFFCWISETENRMGCEKRQETVSYDPQ